MVLRAALGLALFFVSQTALAQGFGDDREFWAEAFATGKTYAADISLISYCLRKDPTIADRLLLFVLDDLDYVVELSRTGAVDWRRAAGFAREVLNSTHFAAADAADPALDKSCADRNVEQDFYRLATPLPLRLRPPFKKN